MTFESVGMMTTCPAEYQWRRFSMLAALVLADSLGCNEIEIYGSGFAPIDGALERLARRATDPSPLVSRRVGLAEAARATALLGDPGVFAVLVQVAR
jgi:threonine dehydrogenase-like Zn-dependent dehydrogenase